MIKYWNRRSYVIACGDIIKDETQWCFSICPSASFSTVNPLTLTVLVVVDCLICKYKTSQAFLFSCFVDMTSFFVVTADGLFITIF
jgi:hypothetical protein